MKTFLQIKNSQHSGNIVTDLYSFSFGALVYLYYILFLGWCDEMHKCNKHWDQPNCCFRHQCIPVLTQWTYTWLFFFKRCCWKLFIPLLFKDANTAAVEELIINVGRSKKWASNGVCQPTCCLFNSELTLHSKQWANLKVVSYVWLGATIFSEC